MADISYEIDDQGAPMDYPEHEKTYSKFIWLTKWGIVANVALLIALAAGFFLGAGLFGGFAIFAVLMVISKFLI